MVPRLSAVACLVSPQEAQVRTRVDSLVEVRSGGTTDEEGEEHRTRWPHRDSTLCSSRYCEDGLESATPASLLLDERRCRSSVIEREGSLADSYEVLAELGRGAFGVVLEVRCRRTGDLRAVKCISGDAEDIVRLESELSIARRLAHSYIVRLHEAIREGSTYHLVMDLCQGGTLNERMHQWRHTRERRGFTTRLLAMYAWQMLLGVAYLHHHRYAHRDVKAENYLLETEAEDSPLKLSDFGLSKSFARVQRMTSQVGTAYTTAPEVYDGSYDEKCDVWSVGVVSFMCAVGYPPFRGETPEATALLVQKGDLRFAEEDWRAHPAAAKALVQQLLTRNPAQRPGAKQVVTGNTWLRAHNGVSAPCGGSCCAVS